jgi:hypothetical protein
MIVEVMLVLIHPALFSLLDYVVQAVHDQLANSWVP